MFWNQLLPNLISNFTCSELTILWEITSPSDCSRDEYHQMKSHIVGKLGEKACKKEKELNYHPVYSIIQI